MDASACSLKEAESCRTIDHHTTPETPVERLERRKADALKEVARLDELIQLFKANPATERILQLLGVGV